MLALVKTFGQFNGLPIVKCNNILPLFDAECRLKKISRIGRSEKRTFAIFFVFQSLSSDLQLTFVFFNSPFLEKIEREYR